MDIFMSLWTRPKNNINHQYIDMWKLSVALCNKNYGPGSVSLITDKIGAEILKDIPFKNIHIVLDSIPNYPSLWTLGKIYAFKYACNISSHFLHVDADVFLWEKLPDELVNSDIFCQSEDRIIGDHCYDLQALFRTIDTIIPEIWVAYRGLRVFNTALFGGTNISFILNYCNLIINDLINNNKYEKLWDYQGASTYDNIRSILLEQATFAIYCKMYNIQPKVLFKNFNDPDLAKITRGKYSHLITMKRNKDVLARVSKRVATEPYDLLPHL